MASEEPYESIDNFSFLQSLPPTGSAYQSFYTNVPGFSGSAQQPSSPSRTTVTIVQENPVFCSVCRYVIDSLDQECVWCQFTNDDTVGSTEPLLSDHQVDCIPQAQEIRNEDSNRQDPIFMHSEHLDTELFSGSSVSLYRLI